MVGMGIHRIFGAPTLSPSYFCSGVLLPQLYKVKKTSFRVGLCKAMAGMDRPTPQEDGPSPSSAIDFLTLCQRLKSTKRTGWIKRGIKDPESIADHMYRMAAMALIGVNMPGIDRDRCVKIAIVHDIAEAIVGDITPTDGISKEEKSQRERNALDKMCQMLGGGLRAKEIYELWNEYEDNITPEAKIVKDFDKVEMILQALEYENDQGKDLDDFFQSTAGKFQTDVGKAWAAEIVSRRNRKQDGDGASN